ncbi:MAG: MM0924 family protein [Pyrinomonadaceae bacterium]
MQEFLSRMIGRKLDVFCGGGSSLSGEVVKVEGGVLHLKDDEDQMCYVAIEKIIVVWESRDKEKQAGFVSGALLNNR